jgi:hypothetical protein
MVASGLNRAKHTKFLWPSEKQGVEDFQSAFAQSRCAVEGKQFLAHPPPECRLPKLRSRLGTDQTNNASKQKNDRYIVRFNFRRCV